MQKHPLLNRDQPRKPWCFLFECAHNASMLNLKCNNSASCASHKRNPAETVQEALKDLLI